MDEERSGRRATVHDVARAAGVSLATVDRVLNARPGVRPQTSARVAEAIARLGFERDASASLLARGRTLEIVFLIPEGANEFMESLVAAISSQAASSRADRVGLNVVRVPALDPQAMARTLDGLAPGACDCAVLVASDDAPVLAALVRAARRSLPLVTLVSDLPGSHRQAFVGIDNLAAGRTAASLLGRFCPKGRIGILAGSLHLKDHRERLEGFRAVIGAEFPLLDCLAPVEGHDDPHETGRLAARLLTTPGLVGLYNLGAGNVGLLAALEAATGERPRVVVHELTRATRAGLVRGRIDIVIDQNPEREIALAIGAARALALGRPHAPAEPIAIGLFVRDNVVNEPGIGRAPQSLFKEGAIEDGDA